MPSWHLTTNTIEDIDTYMKSDIGSNIKQSDTLSQIVFEQVVRMEWNVLYGRFKRCNIVDRLELLNHVPDYMITRRGFTLLWMNHYEPEWIQALINRGINTITPEYTGTPLTWKLVCPETLRILIDHGADPNYSYNERSLLERYADSKVSERVECMKILIHAGADVQPLFDSLYKRNTIYNINSVIQALKECGYDIDLKRMLVYRLHHEYIPYEKLPACFYTPHFTHHMYNKYVNYYYNIYPDYDSMLKAVKEKMVWSLEDIKQIV